MLIAIMPYTPHTKNYVATALFVGEACIAKTNGKSVKGQKNAC
jgi:hypothetical protein